ncbi:MAG TPA: thioesterase domain-containing protein [Jatrophihabitans sp.]|nr:thioesterase domain-containing protein [Jatrophihabitans sp.]
MTRSPWLPYGADPEADVRLVCLPHAGAGAAAFKAWGIGLDPRVRACPAQPPGREKRRAEPPFTTVGPLVRGLAAELAETVAEPYALFGHSTGALCAFEVARELRAGGAPMPVHLFVSGRRAPQLPMERVELAALTPPELAALLDEMGGTPREVLADHDMLKALQPLLAADFAVNQDYRFVPGAPLDVPLTAFAGVEDTGADGEWMAPWREQTAGDFALHELDGGHFAIFDQRAEVHARIAAHLAAYLH